MLQKRLESIPSKVLRKIVRGIEKESLRIDNNGSLSKNKHPISLGSALTPPHITTDFSESQLELITETHESVEDCFHQLSEIHKVTIENIDDELLWCASMPCVLPKDELIPIGEYGISNVGRAKTIYRIGLGNRYGKRMQTISGIHYNFSLPAEAWHYLSEIENNKGSIQDYKDKAYFGLIRNFQRHSWLLLYLFGASPAVSEDFVQDRVHRLQKLSPGVLYMPYATSLRMGPLGYQSDVQSSLSVSYNSLSSYANSLERALSESYPPYSAIGLKKDTEYLQLSTSLLQIENEFYSTIRPKRRIKPGERSLHALSDRGVEYVEVRAIDLNPFVSTGIDKDSIRILDIFLLHCLLKNSPLDSAQEIARFNHNQNLVAQYGRDPSLRLGNENKMLSVKEWGEMLLEEWKPIANALDIAHKGNDYSKSLTMAFELLQDPSLTKSAKILDEMRINHRKSFQDFALSKSEEHRSQTKQFPMTNHREDHFKALAKDSLQAQKELEEKENISFESYRKKYIEQAELTKNGSNGTSKKQ